MVSIFKQKHPPNQILELTSPWCLPPLPVIRRSASDKLKSSSAGTFKELNSLSAPSNQQAFISALQKLADKQAVRQYASSSHINLLTQQVRLVADVAERLLPVGSGGEVLAALGDDILFSYEARRQLIRKTEESRDCWCAAAMSRCEVSPVSFLALVHFFLAR